jgi:hypothetical protein
MPAIFPDPLYDLDARAEAAVRHTYLTNRLNTLAADLGINLGVTFVVRNEVPTIVLHEAAARKLIRRLEEIGDIVIPAEAARAPQPGEGQLALEL